MPASISHEGYSAKPMHSYWDNFWALGGYEASIRIARALQEKKQMSVFIESRDQFRSDLYRSLNTAMRMHKIDYLPGAAELGDFDATSTTIALAPVGETQMLPPFELNATFERYWKQFVERRTDTTWDAYTPYEWRNLGAFIRLRVARSGSGVDRVLHERSPSEGNGISGRRSSVASRARAASSATCRTAGSPPTTGVRCWTCSRTSARPTKRWC